MLSGPGSVPAGTRPGGSSDHRPGVVLATVCAALTVITVNISLLNVGIPKLARELGASNTGLEWIVDGYALVLAGFLLVAGSLGDRFGRRQVMTVGLAVFAVFSLGAALAQSTPQLVAARCGMGLGAACVMPMTLSILTDVYRTDDGLRKAFGVWAATASAGAVVAPLLAGVLLNYFWWGSLFLVNVPTAAVTLVAAALYIPDSPRSEVVRIDWVGGVLSIVAFSALVFGLIQGPSQGWASGTVSGSLVAAVVAGVAFGLWETRSPAPIIDLGCFRSRQFSIGCAVVAMQYFISFGTSFLVTQYMQLVLGLSALATGFALMPSATGVMFIAPLGARAFGRFGARPVVSAALMLAAVGNVAVNLAGVHSSVVFIVGALLLVNISIGLMAPGTTSMVMSAVPPEKAGMASGAQSTTRQLGGAVGVALSGSILAVLYSSSVARHLHGSSAAAFIPAARRSLAGALATTPRSAAVHAQIVQASRDAFVYGLHVAATTTAGIALGCALLVAALLPRRSAVTLEAAAV